MSDFRELPIRSSADSTEARPILEADEADLISALDAQLNQLLDTINAAIISRQLDANSVLTMRQKADTLVGDLSKLNSRKFQELLVKWEFTNNLLVSFFPSGAENQDLLSTLPTEFMQVLSGVRLLNESNLDNAKLALDFLFFHLISSEIGELLRVLKPKD